MTTNSDSSYLDDQLRAFTRQVGKGTYSAARPCEGASRDFFLEVLATAVGQRWNAAVELRMLECGVGDGVWLDAIREQRKQSFTWASGFDVTPEMVLAARQRFHSLTNSRFQIGFLRVGDITKLDAFSPPKETNGRGGRYDLVYCYDVVQQLPETLRLSAIENMLAVTRQDGIVVILDKHRFSAHGIRMAVRKWITANTRWKRVPDFYLLARYPSMTRLARQFRERWGCRTSLTADARREHFALVIHPGKKT